MPPRAYDVVSAGTILGLGALLIACGWYDWPSTDDFCNRALTSNLGVFGALEWLYTQWSGRLATGLALYAVVAGIDVPDLRAVTAAFGAAVVLAAWLVTIFAVERPSRWRLPIFALATAALAFGLYPHLAQTVFWPTGAIVYWFPLLLLLHWLRGARREIGARAPPHHAYAFALSFVLGNAIELVLPIALAYLFALAFPEGRRLGPGERRGLLVRAAGLLLGFALLASAPGNYVRASATAGSFSADPRVLWHTYGAVLRESARSAPGMLELIVALALAAAGLRLLGGRAEASDGASTRWREALALALGAFASVVPVLAVPAQFAPRNALYLLVALFLAVLLPLVAALVRPLPTRAGPAAIAVATAVLAVAAGVRLASDIPLARAHRAEHVARDRALRALPDRDRDVVVRPIAAPAPRTMHAIDIGDDPRSIVNWCVANYYGLHSIAVGPAP